MSLEQSMGERGNSRAEAIQVAPGKLTARENEVLRLLAWGMSNPQIARILTVSSHTIHSHVRSIYSKLGVSSRSAATRYAMRHNLLEKT